MFSYMIKKLRTDSKMTQRQVANRLKLSVSAVDMYEQGRREPSLKILIAYSDLFAVTTDYLLKGEDSFL